METSCVCISTKEDLVAVAKVIFDRQVYLTMIIKVWCVSARVKAGASNWAGVTKKFDELTDDVLKTHKASKKRVFSGKT